MPGDELVTHCVWDSTTKNATVFGGESTTNEMCLSAILYYPNVGVSGCTGDETMGCNCSYSDPPGSCETSFNCTRLIGNCDAHLNCSTCSADPNCGWCNSQFVTSCLGTQYESACTSSLGGIWNSCATSPETLCTELYTNCTECNADTSRLCSWCHFTFGYSSKCLASTASVPTGADLVCEGLGGTYRPTQCYNDD